MLGHNLQRKARYTYAHVPEVFKQTLASSLTLLTQDQADLSLPQIAQFHDIFRGSQLAQRRATADIGQATTELIVRTRGD